MLKIKDNVDLKELERFGFNQSNYMFDGAYFKYRNTSGYEMLVFKNRQIYVNNSLGGEETLFDLIQAGLVEKVGE
jgi:hypothetical protein